MTRSILIDAIIGRGFVSPRFADRCEKNGWAEFTGNQWNPDWSWKRSALEGLEDSTLEYIYTVVTDPSAPDHRLVLYNDTIALKRTTSDATHRKFVEACYVWWGEQLDQAIFDALTKEG